MNRGNGAGGKKSVINGITFENINDSVKTIYLTQSGFKQYFLKYYDLDIYKQPDEAFIIITDNMMNIKILEKKNQNVDGSVEDKLKTGLFNKKEYEKMFLPNLKIKLIVSYAFCVSKFLQNKLESDLIKYKIYKEIMNEDNIKIFYSEDKNYFDDILEWIKFN